MNSKIYYHADDYGVSINSAKCIDELCINGKINSISFLSNMGCSGKAAESFLKASEKFPSKVNVSIHFNLIEGKCLAGKKLCPHICDENGMMATTWGKLFIWNYIPFLRTKIRKELQTEFKFQVEELVKFGLADTQKLRIDSHQHTHMIPVVMDAIVNCLRDNNWKAEYIRNSQDPVLPYMLNLSKFKKFNPVNVIKCLILNFYSMKVRKFMKKNSIPIHYMSGVFFSGSMDERIKIMIPVLKKAAEKKGWYLVVLFHPGIVLPEEICADHVKPDVNHFHLDAGRKIENQTISNLDTGSY